MKKLWTFFKNFSFSRSGEFNSEPRPYRDWQLSLVLAFILLDLVFLGHFFLYQAFLNQSELSTFSNQDQASLNLESQIFHTVYDLYQSRTAALNNLLASSSKTTIVDPSR
jgi:hypothetical protein